MRINQTQNTYQLENYESGATVVLGKVPDGYAVSGGSMGSSYVFNNTTIQAEYGDINGEITFRAGLRGERVPYMVVAVRFKKLRQRKVA